MVFFCSTRGQSKEAEAPDAILKGIAPDGGLYTLQTAPRILPEELLEMNYVEMASKILTAYLPGYTEQEIKNCVCNAYADTFDTKEVAPLEKVGEMQVLELFHGPTAAFKDVALSALPQLMRCAKEKRRLQKEMVILTATSGDTGSAALTGFRDVPGMRVMVFYPDKGISAIQRAQMTAAEGNNVQVAGVKGNFDAAQSGVKDIFANIPSSFCEENQVSFSSANSINFGRLAPQIVYYYASYLNLVKKGTIQMGEQVNFSVPTGNFGDILAGYFAQKSGLPVHQFICASNKNCVLTDFLNTGVYDKNRPFYTTLSPSMDILLSSNLERLLFDVYDGNAEKVREKMESVKKEGKYSVDEKVMNKIREKFFAACTTDEESLETIGRIYREKHYLMDPHTAVAWHAAEEYREKTGDKRTCIVLSTASPYKFPESAFKALNIPYDENDTPLLQMEKLEEKTGIAAPVQLKKALMRSVRFKDVVEPEKMMAYVQKQVMKA